MNFRFFFVIASCFVTFLCNAQVQVSTKQLIGTKWEETSRIVGGTTENPNKKRIIEFDKNVFLNSIYFNTEPTTAQFKYYLSDTEPSNVFNYNLVGTNNKGKHIVLYNDKLNKVFHYTFISLNDDEMVLYHKAGEYKIDCYVTYKRVK